MKIKVKEIPFDFVEKLPKLHKLPPLRPSLFWRTIMKIVAIPDLKKTQFTYTKVGMEKLGRHEPCLILMNHSCFLDLEAAESIFYPRPLNVVCTSDGFVGKNWLMRHIGCIPTNKFVSDFVLVKHIKFAITKLHTSVLMFPEASYSFDGTATTLPESLGKCLKILNVPVVMIKTEGAFLYQPLYNNLQKRNVNVSAEVKYLLSPQEISEKTFEELNDILRQEFTFDNFKSQQERHVKVTEPYRADFLNRVLYKCPVCNAEGKTVGKGINLTCNACQNVWTLTETGSLDGQKFNHIPDWYKWQRECVKQELKAGTYKIEVDVDIYMLTNTISIYKVGKGHLSHTSEGFHLTGCNGKIDYLQKPKASYSLYSDYNWYEIGDMICIGDMSTLYYCFPKNGEDVAAKCRIATEELYKMLSN